MQLFYFSGIVTVFNPFNISVNTRLGLLLADGPIVDGYTQFMVDFDKSFGSLTPAVQMDSIIQAAEKTDSQEAAQLREFVLQHKKMRALKRKDKQVLIAMKRYDQLVSVYTKSHLDDANVKGQEFGYYQLRPLLEEPFVMFYHCYPSRPEGSDEYVAPLSELLQMMGDPYDRKLGKEDIAFVLPLEFMAPTGLPPGAGPISAALPKGAAPEADEEAIWMEPILQLPNINILSAEEIMAIRQELHLPGSAFRAAMDEWIADCHHNRRTVRERARFFEETVRPAAQPIQQAMNENKILMAHRMAHEVKQLQMPLFVVEMPLRVLWDLYEKADALPAETLQKLRALWDTVGRKRFPMFVAAPNDLFSSDPLAKTTDEAFAAALQNMPASARKSIDL